MDYAIRIVTLNKTFASGRKALQGVDLRTTPGEMLALIGLLVLASQPCYAL